MQMRARFGVITLFLVFVISFCVRGTAMSQSEADRASMNRYYKSLEKDFRTGIRETLTQNGLEKSGVMITWVSGEDGERTYKVSINDRSFQRMSEEEKRQLTEQFAMYEFEGERCGFVYELGTA